MPKKVTPRGKAAAPPEVVPAPQPPQKKTARKQRKPATKRASDYIRNKWGSDVRITLSEVNDERRIELKPRGQRGDLARCSKEEWDDDKMDRALVELIPSDLATEIMNGQLTNQQTPHSALEALRNPLGQPYAQAPEVQIPFEQQGTVVAGLQPGQAQGRLDQTETVVRAPGAAPQQVPVPGSVQNPVPQSAAMTQDWLARQGGSEADGTAQAEALRQSLNPRVTETKKNIEPGQ